MSTLKMPDQPTPQATDHELIRSIGSGSFGEVWLARNVMGTYRAVKFVRRANFESARPYEREFQGIRRFEPISRSHEGLVDVLQVGTAADASYFYYVMELADDAHARDEVYPELYVPRTLAEEIRARGALPFETCVSIGLALA